MDQLALADFSIILETEGIKDLLRFAKVFEEKFSRKILLYRHREQILLEFRRKTKQGIVHIALEAKAPRLKRLHAIYFLPRKNRIILRPKQSNNLWRATIIDVEKHPLWGSLWDTKNIELKHDICVNYPYLKFVDVQDPHNLVYYAFLVRDVVLLHKSKDTCSLYTGILSSIFPPVEPFIVIFKSDIKVEEEANFIVLNDETRFVKKLDRKATRYVYLVNIRRMNCYETSKKGA